MDRKKTLGVFFVVLSIMIVTVSAYVYESAQQDITQTVQNVATITLKDSALGSISEGETIGYAKVNVSALGNAVDTTTTRNNVYLHFNSDLDSLSAYYSTYTITVKYATVPSGSSHSVGQTAATMTIASPDSSAVTLDLAGSWTFDFEITTTAKSVGSNQPTTATIVVTVESA